MSLKKKFRAESVVKAVEAVTDTAGIGRHNGERGATAVCHMSLSETSSCGPHLGYDLIMQVGSLPKQV